MSYRLVEMKAEAKNKREVREEMERKKAEETARRKEALAALFEEWTVDGNYRIPAALVTRGDPAVVVPDRRKRTFVLVPCALSWQHGAQGWAMALPPRDQGTGCCPQILSMCVAHMSDFSRWFILVIVYCCLHDTGLWLWPWFLGSECPEIFSRCHWFYSWRYEKRQVFNVSSLVLLLWTEFWCELWANSKWIW